jgi:hypothetical protein
MNDQPDVKASELYVADANLKTNVAYSLPIELARSLQKEVSAGLIKLEAMYQEIQKHLVRKDLPEPRGLIALTGATAGGRGASFLPR